MALDLVGLKEAAERLDRPRITVRMWRKTDPTFPEPDVTIGAGPIWQWKRIEKWARQTGRLARKAS